MSARNSLKEKRARQVARAARHAAAPPAAGKFRTCDGCQKTKPMLARQQICGSCSSAVTRSLAALGGFREKWTLRR